MQPGWFEQDKRRIWLAALVCVVPFLGFWIAGLFDLDEGFYGAVVSDMIRRADWITPTYNGVPWFEKPVLLYWAAIPSVLAFGEAVGPRLPSILATLGLGYAIFRFLKTRFGMDQAVLTAIAYCGSLLAVGLGRMMLTDAILNLCLSLCFILFWEAINGNKRAMVWSGLCLGLAILAKGPVAGLFFLIVAGFAYWRLRELRPGFKGGWFSAIVVCLATVALWYVPCWMENRQVFIDKFLIEQNIGRFSGGDKAHRVPIWAHPIYYPLVLALAALPWLPAAIKGRLFRWPAEFSGKSEDLLRRFLWIWLLSVLIFFSVSGSKLPHYILPALPPLVMLIVDRLMSLNRPIGKVFTQMAVWSVGVCVVANVAFIAMDKQANGTALHNACRSLRAEKQPIIIYRFGRMVSDTSIKLTLNETSRPSTLFYLGHPALMTSDINEAVKVHPQGFVILTKNGSLTEDERAKLSGFKVQPGPKLPDDSNQAGYVTFRAEPN